MSDTPNLAGRAAASEQTATGRDRRRGRLLAGAVIALLCAQLAFLLWMFAKRQSDQRQSRLEHHFWVIAHATYPGSARAEALVELATANNKEWRGARLTDLLVEGLNLPGVDLRGADFEGSKLPRANFAGAKMPRVRFTDCDLIDADFSAGDLNGAEFLRARIQRAQFPQALLRGADLEQVQAHDTNFVAADLSDARLLMADFTRANLSGADFAGANLEAAIFQDANLALARLPSVNLKDADLADCNWWRARGLRSDQIALLRRLAAPTERASAALREDYRAWLESVDGGK